jgi:hypothetical protein
MLRWIADIAHATTRPEPCTRTKADAGSAEHSYHV